MRAAQIRLQSSHSNRKIRGARRAGDVGVAAGVHEDTGGGIRSCSTKESRVLDHGIDDQRAIGVVRAELERDFVIARENIGAFYLFAAIACELVDFWAIHAYFTGGGGDSQIAV